MELCVLSILSRKDCYGYELVSEISKNIEISDGTIYPLLRRLNAEGYFTTYLQESSEGPPRKYYKITELGLSTNEEMKQEWFKLQRGITNIIEGVHEND